MIPSQFCQIILDTLSEGVVIQNESGKIIYSNPRAEDILGLNSDQMMGVTSVDPRWRAVREDGTDFPGEEHPAMVCLATNERQTNVTMGVHKPEGSRVWIRVTASPLQNPEDDTPCVISVFHDITNLKNEELRFKFATSAVEEGIWDWNLVSDEVYLMPKWFEIMGYLSLIHI